MNRRPEEVEVPEASNGTRGTVPAPAPASILGSFWLRAWVAAVVGISLVFLFQSAYPGYIGPISNVLPSVCVGLALLSSAQTSRRYGPLELTTFRFAWTSFAAGAGFWLGAELIWAAYNFIFNVPIPTYSFADLFYILGYFPIFVGLLLYLQTFRAGLDRRRVALSAAVVAVAVGLAVSFVIPTELASTTSLLHILDDLAYPILDLVLLSLTVLTLSIFLGGKMAYWLLAFGAGAVLYVIGDEDYLVLIANGTYYNGSFNDLIFLLAYLSFALAFYLHRKEF